MRLGTAAVLYMLGMGATARPTVSDRRQKERPQTMSMPKTAMQHFAIPSHEVCSRAVDRLLLRNTDFNDVLRENTGSWEDPEFGFPDAVYWEEMRPTLPMDDESGTAQQADWIRISDVFGTDEHSLWGSTGINYKDAKQGYLGDCWIIAAASAVARDPERIRSMFLIDGLNTAGVYAL